jgi:hypothetical protein
LAFGYFFGFFARAILNHDPPTAFVDVEIGVSLTFCLGWPQTSILWISISQAAGGIGVSQHAWLIQSPLKNFFHKSQSP